MTIRDAFDIGISLGLNETQAKLIAAQAAFESANFTSNVFKLNNNPAGIMFINKPFQKNAVPGSSFPASESKTAKYAKFATITDGFRDMIRITYKALKNDPDPATYAANLKAQGYYSGDQKIYTSGLTRYWNLTKDFTKKKINPFMSAVLVASGILIIIFIIKKK
jgi:uncharacterized FlgJ-related protein